MAFDPKPSTWISNWTSDGTEISIPIATFPQLTSAEANATTGDIRKVLFAICERIMSAWNTSQSVDRPAKWTMNSAASVNTSTGQITRTYTFTFVTAATSEEVVNE